MCIPLSILSALISAIIILAILFGYQFKLERKMENDGFLITLTPFEMERKSKDEVKPTGKIVDFNPRIEHYLKVAEVMVTLASASLVFIPTVHIDKTHPMFAYAMVLVGCTVVFGVIFMALLTYYYEMFLFDPRTFGAFRSSMVFSIGFSGLICFAIAYLVLAVQIAIAYSSGTLMSK
jgi:hypothetical protein